MHVLNKITVTPQLPEKINFLLEISNNFWWSWNTEFLKMLQDINEDLWGKCQKNPMKFVNSLSQKQINELIENENFLKKYNEIKENYLNYMNSKNTWFNKNYPNNKNDIIAYFSAEYGLDQIMPIYAGGLGILSGDHLKSASDLGIPIVAIGLLYKDGYFHQTINKEGVQETHYTHIDIENLPTKTIKKANGEDLVISIEFPKSTLYLKVWKVNVGRITLYLLDSDVEDNIDDYKKITSTLYGGNQETRIMQEMVLGIGGITLLKNLEIEPTIYHMNEGHSSFLILELIKKVMNEKKISFNLAKDIVSSKTVFTTHTPVPAGNDVFPISLIEKYFDKIWEDFGITKEEFLKLGMNPNDNIENNGFNMGILALKIAGKKNGVSKLHGEVSRELFSDIWPNINSNEAPITYVTNGIHTCSWLAPNLKKLYNKYLIPFWQDSIFDDNVWKNIKNIPDEELWNEHNKRKEELFLYIKEKTNQRLKKYNCTYEEISEITSELNPKILTIGFARRFATYKRANLIFRNVERLISIINNKKMPVQIIIAGKAHPADKEGQDLIKMIYEISMKPEFKGKIILLEDYNIEMSKKLISGVDIWLNTPRRPMEASGTSGQKASVNGVINFSVLDGWWAEGYNGKNGWKIGNNLNYDNYEIQDNDDSESIYDTLENKIIPLYYNQNESKIPENWIKMMKESIISTGGKFSTSRMLVDYMQKLYIPLCNLTNEYYKNLEHITGFNEWKKKIYESWDKIEISQSGNANNITLDAGDKIEVTCQVKIPNFSEKNIELQIYYGELVNDEIARNVTVIPMQLKEYNSRTKKYIYNAKIELYSGGNYGYTFRVLPKHKMILDKENLNLVKWINE